MSWFTSVGETNLGNVRCELGKTMGVLGFPNVSSWGMFVKHFRSLGLRSCLREFFSDLVFVYFCSIPTSFWVERVWVYYHSPRPTPWVSIIITGLPHPSALPGTFDLVLSTALHEVSRISTEMANNEAVLGVSWLEFSRMKQLGVQTFGIF